MKSPEISGKLLAHNMLLNLIGQGLPLLVGVGSVPFIIRGLGTDRFGLLSLTWVVLGYFAIFDLGLGRATTKFVAEALGKGEEKEIPRIAWTSVTVQALFGLLGSIVLIALTPLLVGRILNVPPELIGEAKVMFYILAPSVPIVLISSSFQGILEAFQRFDLVNAVKIPSSMLTFLLPLLGLYFEFRLPGIVALTLLARIGALLAYMMLDFRIMPQLRKYSGSLSVFPRLFSFGVWVTVTNVVVPIFVYLDRFLIGSLRSISAVAYYAVPYGLVTKLLIIPNSISIVLFPTISRFFLISEKYDFNVSLVTRSIKYTIMTMIPPTVIFLICGKYILSIWLGSDFASESIIVFRFLSIAVMLNAIGYIPYALIQGAGRPDVIAKYHLIELPVYFSVAFFLISRFGINGAALALCLRMTWTIPVFSVLCVKIARIPLYAFAKNGVVLSLVGSIIVMLLSLFLSYQNINIASITLTIVLILICYSFFIWIIAFDDVDKLFIKNIIRKYIN